MREPDEVSVPQGRRMRIEPQPKNPTFLSGFLKSLMSNALIHILVSVFGLWSFIPIVLAAVLFLFGWKAAPPEEDGKKAKTTATRLKDAVKDMTGGEDGERKPVLPSPAGVVAGQATKRIGDKIDDAKDEVIDAVAAKAKLHAEREAAAEREKLIVEARKLHVPFEESWSTDKLRAEVEHARDELVIRQPLFVRAKAAGLDYLEIWPTKELRQHVEDREKYVANNVKFQAALRGFDEEIARYEWELKHGKNAKCPRCAHQMRINPASAKKDLQCPACRYFFTGSRAIALGVKPRKPVKPTPPKPWSLF